MMSHQIVLTSRLLVQDRRVQRINDNVCFMNLVVTKSCGCGLDRALAVCGCLQTIGDASSVMNRHRSIIRYCIPCIDDSRSEF